MLSVDGCRFDSGNGGSRDRGLQWRPQAGVASVVSISNSVFDGSGYGLWMTVPPQRCSLNNLLLRTQRSGLRCDANSTKDVSIAVAATRVTQVRGLTFIDATISDAATPSLNVELTCGESVLAVSTGLIQVAAPENWPLARAMIKCLLPERGNPTIIPPGVHTAIGFDAGINSVVALHDEQVRAEALLIASPVFRQASVEESHLRDDAGWQLLDYEGPKLSQQLPGANIAGLPPSLVIH